MQFFIDQSGLTYDQAIVITQNVWFIISVAISWLLPLLLYFITGILVHAKSSSGKTMSKPMIYYPNFWFGVIYFGLIGAFLLISLVIVPLWLR